MIAVKDLKTMQHTEATTRMKMLNIWGRAIEKFEKEQRAVCSNKYKIIECTEEMLKTIKELEEEKNILIYHVISSNVVDTYNDEFTINDFLYISKNYEEWDQDREDIKNRMLVVYSQNCNYIDCSEFGYIKISSKIGGLKREFS